MQTLIDMITPLFTFLFIDYDGAGTATNGALVTFAESIMNQPLLLLPIGIMLVGLVVGIFSRVISAVRG